MVLDEFHVAMPGKFDFLTCIYAWMDDNNDGRLKHDEDVNYIFLGCDSLM